MDFLLEVERRILAGREMAEGRGPRGSLGGPSRTHWVLVGPSGSWWVLVGLSGS